MSERKEYIEKQIKNFGHKAVAVLPIFYPKEIFTALDLLPVEVWGPPGKAIGEGARRVQSYICSLVRNAASFFMGGGADMVSAALYPHTCDSIQGLATLLPDFGGFDKPVLRFMHPKGEERQSARKFIAAEMKALAKNLEPIAQKKLDVAQLSKAIKLHRQIDEAKLALFAKRAFLPLNDFDFYSLLRRGEFLWPEDHLAELKAALEKTSKEPVQKGTPVMISGYVPEPMELFKHLNSAGAYTVYDDYAAVGRRITQTNIPMDKEPFEQLVELYFSAPPCPTRGSDQSRRMKFLFDRFHASGAKGLLIHELKFCEPELFDVPAIRNRFSGVGVPVLYFETELERELSGQTLTRIEAFIEIVANKGKAL